MARSESRSEDLRRLLLSQRVGQLDLWSKKRQVRRQIQKLHLVDQSPTLRRHEHHVLQSPAEPDLGPHNTGLLTTVCAAGKTLRGGLGAPGPSRLSKSMLHFIAGDGHRRCNVLEGFSPGCQLDRARQLPTHPTALRRGLETHGVCETPTHID